MEKIKIDHFKNFKFPSQIKEHDGKLYFILKTANLDDNRYDSDLYTLRGGEAVRLTSSKDVDEYEFIGGGIVFHSVRQEKDKEKVKNGYPLTVFQILYSEGEAQEFLRLNQKTQKIKWIDQNKFFFTAPYSHALEKALKNNDGDMEKALNAMKEDSDYIIFDEIPYWLNGVGVINKTRSRLYFYDGGKITALTDEFTNVGEMELSSDQSKLAFSCTCYENKEEIFNRLMLADAETLEISDISAQTKAAYGPFQFIDRDHLIVNINDLLRYGINQNGDIYTYSISKQIFSKIAECDAYSFGSSVGSDVKMDSNFGLNLLVKNDALYFISTLNDSSHIMCCNLKTGKITQITKERGIVQEMILADNGFYTLSMRCDDGVELYNIHLDGSEECLSDINGALSKNYMISSPLDLSFENEMGNVIQGFVIPPVHVEKGRKYPTILDIHGGPKTVYGNCFFHEMQYWASEGYAVIFCNPTGGDGRGNEFADIRGKYGTVDFNDIMTFLDTAIKEFDFIDTAKIGVTGGSYGGFMTNWIIGHTDRFKAAASQRSISNWFSFSNMSDIGVYFGEDQISANAWTNSEKMWFYSPLKYADKVKTPTLFLHSDEDYRCPLAEGIQMYYALKAHDVPSRICIFKGENHELSRAGKPLHRIRRLKEITQWMDRYLKD